MEAAAFAPSPAAPAPAPVASDTPHSIVSHTMSERSAQLSEHISLWREDIAAQSEQTRMLVEKNAELRQRLREAENSLMQSRVNTSLGDEAAGKARREFAAAAAQKRAERERALRQSNAEMQRRLRGTRSRTNNGGGGAAAAPSASASGTTPRAAKQPKSARGSSGSGSTPRSSRGGSSKSSNPFGGVSGKEQRARPKSAFASSSSAVASQVGVAARGAPAWRISQNTQSAMGFSTDDFAANDGPSGMPIAFRSSAEAASDPEVQHLRTLFQRNLNTTGTPIGERNAAQRYFAASEIKMNPRGGYSSKVDVPNWDPTPHRTVPHTMRGLRPVVSREPWITKPVRERWKRHDAWQSRIGNEQRIDEYGTNTLRRLNDGLYDSIAQQFNRRKREDAVKAYHTNREPWDGTIFHMMPPSLRGIRSVTDEPWARDEELFDNYEEDNVKQIM